MPPRTSLSHCLSLLTQVVPQDLPTLTQELPGELIEQALAATGTATVRRRRLPAEQVATGSCAEELLKLNPNLLIFVEGLNYSMEFGGVCTDPLQLSVAGRLVYSPHDYAWFHNGLSSYAELKTPRSPSGASTNRAGHVTMIDKMNDLDTLDAAAQQHPILAFLDRIERRSDFVSRRRRSYELLGLQAGSRVADIGCGAGTAVLELAAHVAPGGSSAGVDTNEYLIKTSTERAARAGVDAAFYVGSADALPFETASLQGYRAERLYQHLSQPALAFAEARRVLARGGRIVLVDQDWDTLILDSEDTATTRAIVRGFSNGIFNGVIGRQYHRLLSDAGFEDVKVYADACTSTSFAEYGFFAELLAQTAEASGVVSTAAAAAWLADQRDRGRRGRFFMMMTHFLATGHR